LVHRTAKQAVAALGVLLAATVVWWVVVGPSESNSSLEHTTASSQGKRPSVGKDDLEPGYVMIGGVKRPASDVAPVKRAGEAAVMKRDPLPDFGQTQAVSPDLNPHTKSVAEALVKKNHPERLSPLAKSTPFDPKAYAANPEAYLETIEPGRVFAPAEPGPNVPRIQPLSPSRQTVESGGSVELAVRAAPGAPVTLTSFDLGSFENRLTSITVKADKDGVAKVKFTASEGTGGNANVLAASPSSSGQVKYVVYVLQKAP